jgi:DNA-directed RNA polymerase specialized sigma24 family protein
MSKASTKRWIERHQSRIDRMAWNGMMPGEIAERLGLSIGEVRRLIGAGEKTIRKERHRER